ncbi:MAG: HPr(Ser) kinase/phosphatase, partial [Lachnospiraceae bacterium]|nr:HPr(Ser) kinase/phosphatase [Lachnospiraceae bacterium]
MSSVSLKEIVERQKLEDLTPELDIKKIRISQPDINRPALQLAGYFEHFEATRLQVIGFVEYTYMESTPAKKKEQMFREFLSFDIPAVVFCRELTPDPLFVKI